MKSACHIMLREAGPPPPPAVAGRPPVPLAAKVTLRQTPIRAIPVFPFPGAARGPRRRGDPRDRCIPLFPGPPRGRTHLAIPPIPFIEMRFNLC